MKKYTIILLLIISLLGCKCEGTSFTTSKVENLTNYNVTIKSYKDGVLDTRITSIEKKGLKIIGETGGRTKSSSISMYFFMADSLVVEFDGAKKAVHYGHGGKLEKNPNTIVVTSSRSLYNDKSYVFKTLIDDKCFLETEFSYIFTEQDFLNAR